MVQFTWYNLLGFCSVLINYVIVIFICQIQLNHRTVCLMKERLDSRVFKSDAYTEDPVTQFS